MSKIKILITGGTGLVGSAFKSVKTKHDLILVGSSEQDLTDYNSTRSLIAKYNPDAIIHLAARVGGVKGNSSRVADFYGDNVRMNTNTLLLAHSLGVKKVISLLSTCIYPDNAVYPLTENQVHNGPPHCSSYGYAYAKRMLDIHSRALRQQYGCNFITAIPNNLFGPNDNYHLEHSHVIPAIMRKMHEAKINNKNVTLWGDGSALREFTYSKDIAKILLFLLDNYDNSLPINIGNTQEYSIKEIAEIVAEIVGFNGKIIWDSAGITGQHRKPSDNSKLIKLGWKKEDYTDLKKSLTETYRYVIINYPNLRGVLI